MRLVRKLVESGDVLELEVSYVLEETRHQRTRGIKCNASSTSKQRNNRNQAKRKLSRLLNANFHQGDLFLTFTHNEDIDYKEAEKRIQKLIRATKKQMQILGVFNLKYVLVTEGGGCKNKRIHHHIVISGLEIRLIKELWPYGNIKQRQLFGKDFTSLANYLMKEPKERNKRAWSASKGLEHPAVQILPTQKEDTRLEPIRVPDGYKQMQSDVWFDDIMGGLRKYSRCVRTKTLLPSTRKDEVCAYCNKTD